MHMLKLAIQILRVLKLQWKGVSGVRVSAYPLPVLRMRRKGLRRMAI